MFLDLFPRPKPIMAMLHLKGENRDDILTRAGCVNPISMPPVASMP
jgi:hypothetical protein